MGVKQKFDKAYMYIINLISYGNITYGNMFYFSEIITDIVKNCEFETDEKDDIIIKQGEKGEW